MIEAYTYEKSGSWKFFQGCIQCYRNKRTTMMFLKSIKDDDELL